MVRCELGMVLCRLMFVDWFCVCREKWKWRWC